MALLVGAEWCLAQLLRHQTVAASRAVRIPDTSLRTLENRAGAPLSGHITTMCCLVEVAMRVRCRYLGVLVLGLCSLATHTFAQANSEVAPKHIRVTLLGTARGPRAFVDKAGISTLVEAGGERFLFDVGRGSMQRLVQAGFPMNAVTKLFLTHLHSDHVIGVPDLMLSRWSAAPERKVPLEIWARSARGT